MSVKGRIFIYILGAMSLLGGGITLYNGAGFGLIILGALLLLTTFFESRYHWFSNGLITQNPDWQKTNEIFHDDESSQWVRVWFNAKSGERRYIKSDTPPAP
jgi:hypothetical protein